MYDDVKILKLIDGETIIARVKKEEDFYLLKKVRSIFEMQGQTPNEVSVGLTNWCTAADDDEEVKLSTSLVMMERIPQEEIVKNYISGITGLSL